MIETIVRDYLLNKTSCGKNVCIMKPKTLPETSTTDYIIVQNQATHMTDLLWDSTVLISCFTKQKDIRAAQIANAVLQLLLNWNTDDVTKVEIVNAPFPNHNSTTQEYRYQLQVKLYYYNKDIQIN